MSNQELLFLICLEWVNKGGGSKYYSYYILTAPPPPHLSLPLLNLNVNSFSKNSCTGSFISLDKIIKCKYHLNVFFKSYYTASYAKVGSRKGVGHNIIAIIF